MSEHIQKATEGANYLFLSGVGALGSMGGFIVSEQTRSTVGFYASLIGIAFTCISALFAARYYYYATKKQRE